jgi:hypothetical protein
LQGLAQFEDENDVKEIIGDDIYIFDRAADSAFRDNRPDKAE